MDTVTLSKQNRLFWLGRYSERTYTTIQYMMGQYDRLIDGLPVDYRRFCRNMGIPCDYNSQEDFCRRYLFDPDDPYSVWSSVEAMLGNGMVLRETITSPTLAYLQMARSAIELAARSDSPAVELQWVLDDIMAFRGSFDDSVEVETARNITKTGGLVERISLMLRLDWQLQRLDRELGKLLNRLYKTDLIPQPEALDVMGRKVLDATLKLDPSVPWACQRDGFGNLLQVGRVDVPHDHFRYTVSGSVRLDLSQRQSSGCLPVFRFPSVYTQPSVEMTAWLEGLALPQGAADRAWALSHAVHSRMTYAPGETGVSTTAAQAFAAGRGVCQDIAHIYLALVRQAGLAARYVNGLPEGEGASHAWCEVWLDRTWVGIDPTRDRWTDEGYIRFGTGRDFGDCPMERGVFWGLTDQRQTVFMKVSQQ